jgi:ATP-binding cassette subfamily B protein
MVAKYYGKSFSLQYLRENCFVTREGVSLLGISEAAEKLGLRTIGVNISFDKLVSEAILPCIIHWNQNHFVVLYKICKNKIIIADPAYGLIKCTKEEFLKGWVSNYKEDSKHGVCLFLEPTQNFYKRQIESTSRSDIRFLLTYLKSYKKFYFQLFLSLLFGCIIQLILPFITQSIVDTGINNQNINFIYLALLAQMVLIISRTTVDLIRSRILLHISARINTSIISDFLGKLMRLPVNYFESKITGDLLQRIKDQDRIESLINSHSIFILFSTLNLIIFGIVLSIYSVKIFLIYIIGSIIYIAWILLFLKKKKQIEYRRFTQLSQNNSNILELIEGMQEIKLNNCEQQKRWGWEKKHVSLFLITLDDLSITQLLKFGSILINESKNVIITIIAATSVLYGHMTLGMMLAVQYIIGQLNAPLEQMVEFFQNIQSAKLSFERLNEVHSMEDEESIDDLKLKTFSGEKNINLQNVTFQYEGPLSKKILDNINLVVPSKKITAIVGVSGSGKTTLLKLLLGFYKPTSGEIRVGDVSLQNYSNSWWRSQCGVVLQDGYVFSDSIASNIAISDEHIDKLKLLNSVKVANIQDFIEELPLGYNTKIGKEGNGLSQGQKQRILIARVIYKDPEFVFFDEATNSLDSNNEKVIMENMNLFFQGKTVVIVAHRLSTVKNADQIVVLDKGRIVEVGNHQELSLKKGFYYNLVKNQLEMGG